jgi:hypothetical protein
MKTFLALVAAALLLCVSQPFGRAQAAVPGPTGVSAESWISLGPDAGFVVTRENFGPGGAAVVGFFMARHDGKWVRLEADRIGGVIPVN